MLDLTCSHRCVLSFSNRCNSPTIGRSAIALYIDPPLWQAHGTRFSHLVSDTSLEELHAFARELGLPDRAFDLDHYDVPERKYSAAVNLGAHPIEGRELIRILRSSGLRIGGRKRPERVRIALLHHWERIAEHPSAMGERLLDRWSEPHRTYHGPAHLLGVLTDVERLSSIVDLPDDHTTVPLAAWFHDAVYNAVPGQDENESAALAEEWLGGEQGAEVARLVRLTIRHETSADDTAGAVLLDADLAILAAHRADYSGYVSAVRAEYSRVDDAQWAQGRARVLESFLARDHLYQTRWARTNWEPRARQNLQAELLTLAV